jgi:hydroxymethylglutaryl-CoA lyase
MSQSARPTRVKIVELGPRDGLQNEKQLVSVAAKVALIEALAEAGCDAIEAGSFVSARWVPQMADTEEVLRRLHRHAGVSYLALAPTAAQVAKAVDAGLDAVAVFPAATETFSRKNLNASIDEALRRSADVARVALGAGLRVRGYVSCAIHCPFEGWVDPKIAARLAAALRDMGCYEVSLCDTTGAGTADRARAMVEEAAMILPMESIAVHFHDTYGQALANTAACLDLGVATIDSAVAGLGGCPFAPGAAGNLATEDLLYMLDGLGIETGIDINKLAAAGRAIMRELGRASTSRVATVLAGRQTGAPGPTEPAAAATL